MFNTIFIMIIAFPFVLTGWNIYAFLQYLINKKDKRYNKLIEIIALGTGILYLFFYMDLIEITSADWDAQLYYGQFHSIISTDTYGTITALILLAFTGYLIIRFIPVHRQAPLVSVFGITAAYIGIGICVIWCIQTKSQFFLILLPVNCIIILIKSIYILVCQRSLMIQNQTSPAKCRRLAQLLNKANNLPWLALLFIIPLLGIIIVILCIFGQEPDSIIKAWTDTADWTLSQKIPPQDIPYNGHYLCTVAAGGHSEVVKPIRTGIRHGHRIVVNRQLCVANAFEQILEEKTPVFHKLIRKIYDSAGYPISKQIHSKYTADFIYYLMKPLEWIFLIVLYTVDVQPENRIAIQYPHAPVPEVKSVLLDKQNNGL